MEQKFLVVVCGVTSFSHTLSFEVEEDANGKQQIASECAEPLSLLDEEIIATICKYVRSYNVHEYTESKKIVTDLLDSRGYSKIIFCDILEGTCEVIR